MNEITKRETRYPHSSLWRALDRFYEDVAMAPWIEGFGAARPTMDVYETDDAVTAEITLPGVKPKDVQISVNRDTLTVRGEIESSKSKEENGNGIYTIRERQYGSFARTITLPADVDTDHAEAEFQDGILKINLPKTENQKSKVIPVKIR